MTTESGAGAAASGRRRAWRYVRIGYLLVCNTLLVLIAIEVTWRATSGLRGEGRAPRMRRPTEETVGYTLHPFQQMANPPTKGTDPGPLMFGWRVDPPDAVTTPGRKRIFFLGGSTTANEYPSLVRRNLEERLGPVTVYNLSFSWHSSLHSLYKFWTYVDDFQPDLVVVLHAINDFYRAFTPPTYSLPQYHPDYSNYSGPLSYFWNVGHAKSDGRAVFYARPLERVYSRLVEEDVGVGAWVKSLAETSEVLRALRVNVAPAPNAGAGPEPHTVRMPESVYLRSLPAFVRNMTNLRQSCEEKGVPVLFLTMPFRSDIDTHTFAFPAGLTTNDGVEHLDLQQFDDGMLRFNAAVLALQDDRGSYVLDLYPSLRDPSLFGDEVHLEPEGLELEARLVADYVLERALIAER